jgi:hypothetical protein
MLNLKHTTPELILPGLFFWGNREGLIYNKEVVISANRPVGTAKK